MALLCIINKTVLFAANREVTFTDSLSTSAYKLTLPKYDNKSIKPTEDNNDDEQLDEEVSKKKTYQCEESNGIQNIAVSPNQKLLVITTSGDKLVYMYNISTADKHELVSKRNLSRISSAMAFTSDSRYLYVADKTGDCYEFDCENLEISGKWILGHLSMVLDLLATPDNRFIITCDRDEKIRVTNYPATHLIETYCLGHTEYVSAIAFLPTNPNQLLVSISGDKTLKLWRYIEGMEVFEFSLPAAGLKMIVRQVDEHINHIAITLFEGAHLIIYEVKECVEQKFVFKVLGEYNFHGIKEISSLLYEVDGNVLLSTVKGDNSVALHRLVYVDETYVERDSNEINDRIASTVLDLQYNFENVSMLFKKRYDNIKDYHERKKRRIEDQIRNS